jgi:tetratricopeptide (TPR) repeat protein
MSEVEYGRSVGDTTSAHLWFPTDSPLAETSRPKRQEAMSNEARNIFKSDKYQIDFFDNGSDRMLFTFTEFGHRGLEGRGYGGNVAEKNGFDLIATKSNADDWYQALDADALPALKTFLCAHKAYGWRAAYGSSMGGYAAFRFSRDLGLDAAFAISPQFDITQEWDRRWDKQAAVIGSMRVMDAASVRPGCRYSIAYDPADPDRLHIAKFADIIPDLQLLRVPHAGHPVGYFLQKSGALRDVAESYLMGKPATIGAEAKRSGRCNYPEYLFNLSEHCIRRKKLKWATTLIERAVALKPLDADFNIRAALVAERRGGTTDAIAYASVAAVMAPNNPHIIANLARMLASKKLYKQALAQMNRVVTLAPDAIGFKKTRDDLEALVSS